MFRLLTFFLTIAMLPTHAQTFDLQGHRGCRGLMPENSIPAFLHALDLGITTLELDVVISKDRQVVVSHEPFFNTEITSDASGRQLPKDTKTNLYQLDYKTIKTYDCGSIGNHSFPEQQKIKTYKPLLSEVFKAVENHCKKNNLKRPNYNIEIKSEEKEYDISQPTPTVFSNLVYPVILKFLSPERVTLQSFDFNVLRYWHQQFQSKKYKKVKLAALVANLNGLEKNLEDLGFIPDIYSPYFKLLDSDKVATLHQKKILVIPWTVNEIVDMKAVILMGVDGLITDYPNRFKTL